MNVAIIIGRLVRDPELRFIPSSGLAVTKMTIAVDRDLFGDKKQQASKPGETYSRFYSCNYIWERWRNHQLNF